MKNAKIPKDDLLVVGWREWVSLPDLGILGIKAKVDTGARTSALHAFRIVPFKDKSRHRVSFSIHPLQGNPNHVVDCEADVHDIRWVSDSGGHRERRYVIQTHFKIGEYYWPIEMTLTNRDSMTFRMLLGRTAMKNKMIINPSKSFLTGYQHQLIL